MKERAVLYARVSGDDRNNEGRNLAEQLKMCRKYAQQKGYSVIDELSEDDRGASGASFELPQLIKAQDLATSGAYDVLVTREIDRFARTRRYPLGFNRNSISVAHHSAQLWQRRATMEALVRARERLVAKRGHWRYQRPSASRTRSSRRRNPADFNPHVESRRAGGGAPDRPRSQRTSLVC